MNGTVLPKSIKELSYEKELTLFIDGDRGGELIARNVVENAKVGYITRAQDGKEVEELTGKEILSALRKKIPVSDFFPGMKKVYNRKEYNKEKLQDYERKIKSKELTEKEKERFREILEEIGNKILILNSDLEIIKESPSKNLLSMLSKTSDAYTLVSNTLTPNIVRIAEKAGIKQIIARNFAYTGETEIEFVGL